MRACTPPSVMFDDPRPESPFSSEVGTGRTFPPRDERVSLCLFPNRT